LTRKDRCLIRRAIGCNDHSHNLCRIFGGAYAAYVVSYHSDDPAHGLSVIPKSDFGWQEGQQED
jgi:hypothetical protein